jgi:hypothetical protein
MDAQVKGLIGSQTTLVNSAFKARVHPPIDADNSRLPDIPHMLGRAAAVDVLPGIGVGWIHKITASLHMLNAILPIV